MRAGFVVLAIVLLGGCKDFFAPMPGDPVLVAAPVSYRRWYAQAETCSGLRGDFDRVRWYRYEGDQVPSGDGVGRGAAASTWAKQHKIAIAESYAADSGSVTHEALHDILGVRGHPVEYFGRNDGGGYYGGKCSAFVNARPR